MACAHGYRRVETTFIDRVDCVGRRLNLLKLGINGRSVRCTTVDSFVRSATIRSLEVGVIGKLAGAASVGASALGGVGMAFDFVNGASGGRFLRGGRVFFEVAILLGREGKARGSIAGVVCLFGGPAARTSDPGELSDS